MALVAVITRGKESSSSLGDVEKFHIIADGLAVDLREVAGGPWLGKDLLVDLIIEFLRQIVD